MSRSTSPSAARPQIAILNLRFPRRERRPLLARCIHRLNVAVSNLSQDRYERSAKSTRTLTCRADVTTRGALAGAHVCVRRDYMEFSDYATDLPIVPTCEQRTANSARTVIIIISRLIIVIRGGGARCHRQINAPRDQIASCAYATLAVLPCYCYLLLSAHKDPPVPFCAVTCSVIYFGSSVERIV